VFASLNGFELLNTDEAAGRDATGAWVGVARVGVDVLDTEELEVETELGYNEGLAEGAVCGVAQRDEVMPLLLFAKVGVRAIVGSPPTG
jgi:hypothetical protein